jgi:hypothetical protein
MNVRYGFWAKLRTLLTLQLLVGFADALVVQQTFTQQTFAQQAIDYDKYVLRINRAIAPIILDGKVDEEAWKAAEPISNFVQHFPLDSTLAQSQVQVRAAYDDTYIYFSFVCPDSSSGDAFVQSLRRDFDPGGNDGVAVFLDPLNTKITGFGFGVTPNGVQREGFIAHGGAFGVDHSWDNIWISESYKGQGFWSAELAIPFKSIRFESNRKHWRVNFARWNWKLNELATWTQFPLNFRAASLAHTGILEWDTPPHNSGFNLSIIPSVTGIVSQNYADGSAMKPSSNIGADLKYSITPSLNLDVTILPDFSNVNVDRQITNLDRFSIFFPEQRQFFIENSDLFSSFGFSRARPFFSRRIGLHDGKSLAIPFGARLSGNLTQDLRVGLMNIQTNASNEAGTSAQNYTVAAAQYRVLERSNVALIFVNRQGDNFGGRVGNNFNRTLGGDFNYASADGAWQGKVFYHHLFTPETRPGQFASAGWLRYNTPNVDVSWNHEIIGEHYVPEVGFTPRKGIVRFQPNFSYTFLPTDRSVLNQHGVGGEFDVYLNNRTLDVLDRSTFVWYFFNFANTAGVSFFGGEIFTRLTEPFDVTGLAQTPLPKGEYRYWRTGFDINSDRRQPLTFSAFCYGGGYFNGNSMRFGGSINYRFQPFGSVNVNIQQDNINLPSEYNSARFTLIGTQVEFTPTRDVFLTTFVQYNTQIQNMNVNSRLQWRFAPMSDLFLVYTDNYGITPLDARWLPDFTIRNRGIALKITYWFNT